MPKLDIDGRQFVALEEPRQRRHRVIEEVLVVDGVELHLVHEITDVRRLDDEDTFVAQRTSRAT